MIFNSLRDLTQFINEDSKKPSLNPIRFINIETIQMWIKVKAMLVEHVSNYIKLSNLCEDEDTAPNLLKLKSLIKCVKASSLITPLSEYLRINSVKAEETYNSILKTGFENDVSRLRVYIPVYRMKDILKNLSADARMKECIHYLDSDEENNYSLTIIQNELDISIGGNELYGFKEYLSYWEQNPEKPIVFHTKNAIYYSDVVFSDNVEVIITAHDLLRKHYNLPINIREDYGSAVQWRALALNCFPGATLNKIISSMLEVTNYSRSLFDNWCKYEEEKKWILWLWSKISETDQNSYIKQVLDITDNVSVFIDNICCHIFSIKEKWESIYAERLELISKMGIILTTKFWKTLESVEGIEKIRALTDLTLKEKEQIVLSLNPSANKFTQLRILRVCYPLLASYLEEFDFNDKINKYFTEYNWLKVLNKTTQSFVSLVDSIANEQGERFYSLMPRNVFVSENYSSDSVILFVDAMGFEYAKLLENLFNTHIEICYCNLPSTTDRNNDFFQGRTHIAEYDLDTLKHKAASYPSNIISEIDYIFGLKTIAEDLLNNYKKVIITSDHGSSRQAVLARGERHIASKSAKKEKWGRLCYDEAADYSNITGIIQKDGFWVFANYAYFSESGSPSVEIHGGAALEEVLVPGIVLTRTEKSKARIDIKIDILTKEIKMPIDRKVIVKFRIDALFDNVYVMVDNKKYSCSFINGVFEFDQIIGDKDEYTGVVFANEKIGEIKYKVIKGISSSKFNI